MVNKDEYINVRLQLNLDFPIVAVAPLTAIRSHHWLEQHFTARCSYASAVLWVVTRNNSVRLSIFPSVCLSYACFVTTQTMHCRYFDITRKGNHSSLWHQQWLVGDALFCLKFALKVTHPLRNNADFDRFPLITFQPI